MIGERDILDLLRMVRDAAEEIDRNTGERPDTIAMSRAMAEQYGVFSGAMIDDIRIMVVGEPVPKRPWYSENWDIVAIVIVGAMLAALVFGGPATRPDCISPITFDSSGKAPY